MTMRTKETEEEYQLAKKNGDIENLTEVEPKFKWTYWNLISNKFPHDKINTNHDIIVLKRECDLWELTNYEIYELFREILPFLDKHYDYLKLNFESMRSVNNVPHLHVCCLKGEYK